MNSLIDHLLLYGDLNPQQIELIRGYARPLRLAAGEYFSEAGRTANRVGYLTEGIFRVCYYNKEGREVTRYFISEGEFVADLNSYVNRLPATEYIEAVTDAKLLVFPRRAMQELSATVIVWDGIIEKITTRALMAKVNKISPMLAEDAATRYARFLEEFPGLANRIPLSLLASYIGITPSSLSRIRRN